MVQSLFIIVVILCMSLAVKGFVISHRFNIHQISRAQRCAAPSSSSNDQNPTKNEAAADVYHLPGSEGIVDKPLTHIKQNKYAPTTEEAKTMTDEEFRKTIYKRMKDAEIERRKRGPIGGQVSDDYLDSLSRKQ